MRNPFLLAPLLALGLSGCFFDGSAQEGTSSETQTALQELADNAGSIASRMGADRTGPTPAARRQSDSDSTWAQVESSLCSGLASSSRYDESGIDIDWIGPGTGNDGRSAGCRLAESIHPFRQFRLDSLGRSDFRGTRRQFDTLQRNLYEGSGTWDLRSGLSLSYLRLSAYTSPALDTFHQVILFRGNCRIDVRMRDTLLGSGWSNSGADAPVVCDGATVGRFVWNQVDAPRVLDAAGRQIQPRTVHRAVFPEDGLGATATILGIDAGTRLDSVAIRSALRWRFLDWDSLAVVDTARLLSGTDRAVAALDGSPDTVVFLLPRRAAAPSGSPYLELPFRSGRGWARCGFPLSAF